MPLCCDASANFGSKPVDISKYGVIYAAGHKNFTTSGVRSSCSACRLSSELMALIASGCGSLDCPPT